MRVGGYTELMAMFSQALTLSSGLGGYEWSDLLPHSNARSHPHFFCMLSYVRLSKFLAGFDNFGINSRNSAYMRAYENSIVRIPAERPFK